MAFCTHPLFLLTVLLLKERKRRICHTVWEILSGMLVFVILILMRQLVKHDDMDRELRMHNAEDSLDYIIFYPKTDVIDEFMPNVLKKLSTRKGLYTRGFKTSQELQNHLRINNNETKAVVYFRNFSRSIPHLDYTIGLIDDRLQHKQHFMKLIIVNSMNAEESATLELLQLQWAIDRSFMEHSTGNVIDHNVSFTDYKALHANRPSHPLDNIFYFLIFCMMTAPLPFFLYNHWRFVKERRSGLKELMIMMGVTPTVLRASHLFDTLFMSLIYSTLITTMLKITNMPILPNSNFFVVSITIILHFLNITSMAFVTSILSQGYEHSNGLALVSYISSCALCIFWYKYFHSSDISVYLGCFLLPHAPIYLFWDEVKFMENAGVGVDFINIAKRHPSIYTYIPVIYTWLAFILQLIFVWALAWYLDIVIPGIFGVPRRGDFLFRRDYWRGGKRVHFRVTSNRSRAYIRDARYFQKVPTNMPVAIKLDHISKFNISSHRSKKYINHTLSEINLDIYQGEVTVVLGVEGSGKSTLVSVITGMTKATMGNIYVNGYDTTMFLRLIQKDLGYCPQHHLTFGYLTVEENITLFELLRGERQEIKTVTDELMVRLRLKSKADMYSYQLTPSAERCLQVACALAGGAGILILDQPTFNCDSETRHYLWDIIMELRGKKTIVMTTSSIEEADAVGDRIALLSKGRLRCHGTPKFLKNAIGTGFNLSVTLKNKHDAAAVRALVENTLHGTVTTKLDPKRLLFTLPAKDHELFPDLFDDLEEKKAELGIANMGVGMSLEEMFLGFIEDEHIEDAMFVETYHGYRRLRGWRRVVQQIVVLVKRNFAHLCTVQYQFTLLQVLVPIIGFIVMSVATNSFHENKLATNKTTTVLVDSEAKRGNFGKMIGLYPDLKFLRTNGPTAVNVTKHKLGDYSDKNLIKFVMKRDNSDLYIGLHSLRLATKALNAFSNIYMSDVVPRVKPITLSEDKIELFMPKDAILCLFWAIGVTCLVALSLVKFIALSIRDHEYLVLYTHRAVGCSNLTHWIAKLISQSTMFLLVIPPAVTICAKTLDKEETFIYNDFIGAICLAQVVFLVAFLLQLYVLSFFLKEEFAAGQIYIQSFALGLSGPVIQRLLLELSHSENVYQCPLTFLAIIGSLSPVYTLSETITSYTAVAREKSFCLHNDHYCKGLVTTSLDAKLLDTMCCDPNRKQPCYYSGHPLTLLLILISQIMLYACILVLLQKKKGDKIFERIVNANYAEPELLSKDPDVLKEKAEVDRMINCGKVLSNFEPTGRLSRVNLLK